MRVVLPLAKPIVDGLPGYSIVQSISLLNPYGINWFSENYIQFCCSCRFNKSAPLLEANFINLPKLRQYNGYEFSPQQIFCPFFNVYGFDANYILYNSSVIDFIRDYIKIGRYVVLYIDRKFVPEMKFEYSYAHVTLVFGYDDKEKVFFISDYAKKLSTLKLPYKNMAMGFSSAVEIAKDVTLSYNVDGEPLAHYFKVLVIEPTKNTYEFDMDIFRNTLEGYFKSKVPMVLGNALYFKTFDDKWGISSYDAFLEYINAILESDKCGFTADLRQFHLLYQHKVSLNQKLTFLLQKGYSFEKLVLDMKKVEQNSLIMRNLMIKFNMKQSKNAILEIKKLLIKTLSEERIIIEQLLNALQKT